MPVANRASFVNFCPTHIRLEAPDAAAILELRTGVDARGTRAAIGNLAGIRWQSDVDVHVAGIVERDVLFRVAAADGKSIDDDLRRARRLQLSRRQLEAADVRRRRVVEIAVPQLEAGAADGPELLADDIGFTVAVRVAKPDDAAGRIRFGGTRPRAAPQDDVDVAVVVDDDVAALADAAFVHHERAESGRQRQAAVVRIACRQTRLRRWRCRRLRRGRSLTTQRHRAGRADTRKHQREKYAFHGEELYSHLLFTFHFPLSTFYFRLRRIS